MDNPLVPGSNNSDLESDLAELPEKVADALLLWRRATLDSKKVCALTYLAYKNEPIKRTVNEIEALVDSHRDCYEARLQEAVLEAEYVRKYEGLLCAKRLSGLRTAY